MCGSFDLWSLGRDGIETEKAKKITDGGASRVDAGSVRETGRSGVFDAFAQFHRRLIDFLTLPTASQSPERVQVFHVYVSLKKCIWLRMEALVARQPVPYPHPTSDMLVVEIKCSTSGSIVVL
jgi:hypothetical protein